MGVDILLDIARKQDTALQESEKKYHTLFETVRDAIYITTRDGRFVDFNPALVELFGYTRDELLRLNANDLYMYSEDRLLFQQEIEQRDTVKDYEVKLRKNDGTVMDCLLTSTVRRASDGYILGYQGIIRDITESKRAKKLIQASEERYHTLFGNSPVAITLLDPTGVIIDCNNATENLIGYAKEEIIGNSFGNLSTLDPKDLPKLQANYQKLAQGREVEPYELEIIRKDGTRRWITVINSLLKKEDVVEGIQIIANDITDRKRIEAALRKSEKQLRAQYKGIPIPTYTWQWVGNDFKLVNYNNAAVVITEGNVSYFIGKTAKEMFHDRPDVQEDILNCFTKKITIKREMLYRFTFKKSKYLAVSYVFVPPDLVMIHTEDITARKRAEMAQQESEAKFRSLVENAPNLIFIVDRDGTIQFANRTVSGFDIKTVIRRSIYDYIEPNYHDVVRKTINRVFKTGKPDSYTIKGIGPHRHISWYETQVGAIKQDGQIVAATIITLDITERKMVEEKLRIQHDLAVSLSATSDLMEALNHILRTAFQIEGVDSGGVYLVNRVTGELDLVTHQGLSPRFVEMVSHYSADEPRTHLVMEGTPIYQRVSKFPSPNDLQNEGLCSLAVIPIQYESQVVAILNLASHTHDEIPASARNTMETLAVQIGSVIARVMAEDALRESEAKYSTLVEQAKDGVVIVQDGVFKFANQAATELSGYKIDELVGRPFSDLLTPESRDRLTQRYQLRMAGEKVPSVYEAKIQCKDGTTKDVEISAGIIQYQGRPADNAIVRDITMRKQTEEELRKLSRAVEQSPSIVMITDTQGIIEYVNPKFTQITGYTPEEIIGINARDLGEQLTEEEQQMWDTICSGVEWRGEFPNKKKNGDLYLEYASISPIKNLEGVITHFLKVAEDITARKRVEEALRASEERYRSLFEESPISLWEEDFSTIKQFIDNLQGKGIKDFRTYFEKHPEAVAQCAALAKVVDVNKMTLEMYEARNKEELLKGLSQVFGKETYDVFREELISLTEGKTVFDSEAINQTLTGNKLHIHLRWSVAPGYEDTWKKILISILDITSHKQAEEAKREFEKSQTNFIEITSHELRTPLTAIRGYTEFLNQHLDELDQASRNQSFEMINRNIQRLERLIKGVSTLGLLERGVFRLDTKKVNFCDIINEALQPYQTRLGQQLEYQSCPDKMSVIIKVDPDRLLQILDNLLENAVKQTPQDQRKIIVTPEILPNIIRVHVADNGAGIAHEDLDSIFKPFTAIPTKYSAGGTGIGLYLARMLTEAHGGTLTAHSKGKGGGATFIMELPRKKVD